MAILLQVTCLTFLLGMTYIWGFPSFFDEPFDEPFDDDWSSLPMFDDFDRMMATSLQEFQQISALSSAFFKAHSNDMTKIKNKLATVTPVCTTTPNSFTTTVIQNNSQQQISSTQTTTCIQELIINGIKYIYREIKVTDDQGIIISQNSDYQSFTVNTINNTTSPNIDE